MAKHEMQIVISAKDDASSTMKRVGDIAVRETERIRKANADIGDANFAKMKRGSKDDPSAIKQIGEAGKSGALSDIGEIFEKNVGLGGATGAVAKGVGASMITRIAAAEISAAADKLREMNTIARETAATLDTIAFLRPSKVGEMARAVPVIGDLIKSLDNLREAGADVIFGRDSVEKINADAAAIDKRIGDLTKRRKLVIDIIQNYAEAQDPTLAIERERKEGLDRVKRSRAETGVSEADAAAAAAAVNAIADEKRRKLRESFAIEIEGINRITRDAFRSIDVAGADTVGEAFQIKLEDIGRAVEQRKADIDRAIADAKGGPGTDSEKRIKVSVLEQQRGAVEQAGEAERKKAEADRDKALAAEKTSREADAAARADRVNRITREALQVEIDLGNEAAKAQGEKLAIAERYAERLKAINEQLKDEKLTAEQRAALEAAKGGLAGQAEREMAGVGVKPGGGITVEQGNRFASAVDGRHSRESIAARSQVDVYRDTAVAAKKTADNTKAAADASLRAAKATEDLLAWLRNAPSV